MAEQSYPVIRSRVDKKSPAYAANLEANSASLQKLEDALRLSRAGGGEKYVARHKKAGKLLPRERVELMRLTAEIARDQAIGVLFTEHDMDVVFEHADRILVLNRGNLIAEGTPEQVRANPEVQAVYLGEGLVYDARHREGAPA